MANSLTIGAGIVPVQSTVDQLDDQVGDEVNHALLKLERRFLASTNAPN